MTKHELERKRDLFILLGAISTGLGAVMPFRSKPEGAQGMALTALCSGGLIAVGLMQFRLASVLHRRAESGLE